jgi:hypothetical protein
MARYDERAGWNYVGGYDEMYRRGERGGQHGGGAGWAGGGQRGGWRGFDRDSGRGGGGFGREGQQQGDGGWGERTGSTMHGPSRYGLGPYYQRLLNRRRPDEELKEEVEEALFYDSWVDAESISVEVSDGVVTLRGELPDYEEIRYAIDDAWDVDGVRGVRSELSVRSDSQ